MPTDTTAPLGVLRHVTMANGSQTAARLLIGRGVIDWWEHPVRSHGDHMTVPPWNGGRTTPTTDTTQFSDQRHRRRTADAPPAPSDGSAICRPRPEGHAEAAALPTLCTSHSASRDVYDSQSPNRARRRHRVWATERTQTRCVVLLRAAAASRPPAATIEDLGDPASGQSANRTPRRGVRR